MTHFGLRPAINATGRWTKVGNAVLSPRTRAAMDEISQHFVTYADLQAVAGRVIAQITGAESGYVTSGAASGITLGIAACIAGLDPDRTNALPRPVGPPRTVLLLRQHRGFYKSAIRAAGAVLRMVDGTGDGALERLANAIDADTACVFFDCSGLPYLDPAGLPRLTDVVSAAHAKGVSIVADASLALPPAENLVRLTGAGTDIVVFSGGKGIQGPPASGFVACREWYARSIAVQHQDVNVWAELTAAVTPTRAFTGIGRGHKVGKEQIVGLLVALQEFRERDHRLDAVRWDQDLQIVEGHVTAVPGIRTVRQGGDAGGVPFLRVVFRGIGPDERCGDIRYPLARGSRHLHRQQPDQYASGWTGYSEGRRGRDRRRAPCRCLSGPHAFIRRGPVGPPSGSPAVPAGPGSALGHQPIIRLRHSPITRPTL